MPDLLTTIAATRTHLAPWRKAGVLGLVPTMGALHAGHGELIAHARRDCPKVVVSIFVNPLQFDRDDDLQNYPRRLQADLQFCEARGVDAVFAPSPEEIYPVPPACTVDVGRLADHLCGAHRPGHFRGVATIVTKLFQIVQPDRAYFGEKDAQQLAIIRRLVADFDMPLTVVPVATVREPDGLALSSRNQRLSSDERALAPVLHAALLAAESAIRSGIRDIDVIKAAGAALIPTHQSLRLEYFEVVDPFDLQPVRSVSTPVLVAGALWVGATRLIDNVRAITPRKG